MYKLSKEAENKNATRNYHLHHLTENKTKLFALKVAQLDF